MDRAGGVHVRLATVSTLGGDTVLIGANPAFRAVRNIGQGGAAGLDEVPCWIRDDLTEDEAFMFLVTDNNQGELSPLEIGLHALEYVDLGKRGAGNSGEGLAAYAGAIGKTAARITQVRQAAEVYKLLTRVNNFDHDKINGLISCSKHLTEIHKAPASLWPVLVSALLAKEWSVKDTKHFVGKVRNLVQLEKKLAKS